MGGGAVVGLLAGSDPRWSVLVVPLAVLVAWAWPAPAPQLRQARASYRSRRRPSAARPSELAAAVARVEQQERQRLAVLLHDDVQQTLAAARLYAGTGGPSEATQLIDDAMAMTRRLSHAIAPAGAGRDLSAVLDAACAFFRSHHRLSVERSGPDGVELPEAWTEILAAVVRELLFNVLRHAPGARAEVHVDPLGDWVRVRVRDDGPGWPEGAGPGFGLASVQQRVEAAGGHVDAFSAPGQGTCVTLCVPASAPA